MSNMISSDSASAQYLIAPRNNSATRMFGVQPMSTAAMRGIVSTLERSGNIQVIRTIKSSQSLNALGTFTADGGGVADIHVVKMSHEYAKMLKQSAPQDLIIEEDCQLNYGQPVVLRQPAAEMARMLSTESVIEQEFKFKIVASDGTTPVDGAVIILEGDAFPINGTTDKNGEAALKLHVMRGENVKSIFINPISNYWDFFAFSPNLSASQVNTIKLKSLSETVPNFPVAYKFGWGQKIMELDRLPDEYTGRGVKIAIIDSGADKTHPLLGHLSQGIDLTNNNDKNSWADDKIGHGTHCAGTITAKSSTGMALRGFAPEADIHILKVFPGGRFSSLLDALDYCIKNQIDIVNMSLGSSQISQTVEQKLEEVIENGIACIVAAGNSSGTVQYPASSPNALAVSAIGKINEFPGDSWDKQTIIQNMISQDGIFSPNFTCFGPQIAVCAPGVGIISTAPNKSFESQSGTSMAAPHVTGLAALVLAHHPVFKNELKERNKQRVAGLYSIIKGSCIPINFGAERVGAGLPNLRFLSDAVAQQKVSSPSSSDTSQPTIGKPSTSIPAVNYSLQDVLAVGVFLRSLLSQKGLGLRINIDQLNIYQLIELATWAKMQGLI